MPYGDYFRPGQTSQLLEMLLLPLPPTQMTPATRSDIDCIVLRWDERPSDDRQAVQRMTSSPTAILFLFGLDWFLK
jgi:hypothetical protein